MKLESKATRKRHQMHQRIARRKSLKQLVHNAATHTPRLPAMTLGEAVEAARGGKKERP